MSVSGPKSSLKDITLFNF